MAKANPTFFTRITDWFLGRSPVQASSVMFDSGGQGYRMRGNNPSRLGRNTQWWVNHDQSLARTREQTRNNPWASSAQDCWENSIIGDGIKPHFLHPDPKIREAIQTAWDRWAKVCDFSGKDSFYGIQAIICREDVEAGESFIRYRIRKPQKGDTVCPLRLQILPSEQCPVNRVFTETNKPQGFIRMGIEFDDQEQVQAYWMYKHLPGDASLFMSAMTFAPIRIPAEEIQHVFKSKFANQLRGEPKLVPVLALLHDLDSYTDSELYRKLTCSRFTAFIEKPTDDDSMFPSTGLVDQPAAQDVGVDTTILTPGTLQILLPNEKVVFPTIPNDQSFDRFVVVMLRKFAAGVGMTYEDISHDLTHVSYSSIRQGVLNFRRQVSQFQDHVVKFKLCDPVMRRWMQEAVLSGTLSLPEDFFDDPEPYYAVDWNSPAFDWIDPVSDVKSNQDAVRLGFKTRSKVIRELGDDPVALDNETAIERQRSSDLHLIYDSNPNDVLLGRESVPPVIEQPVVTQDTAKEDAEDEDASEGK